jgi:hypothetical protein
VLGRCWGYRQSTPQAPPWHQGGGGACAVGGGGVTVGTQFKRRLGEKKQRLWFSFVPLIRFRFCLCLGWRLGLGVRVGG